jgi:diguanylate cyclase (GGDEF)-like protein/PAS domain S-box-containing protein
LLLLLAIISHQFAEMGLTLVSSDVDRLGHIDLLSSATLMTSFAIAAIILLTLALLGARSNAELRERDRRLNLAINAMSQGFLLFDGEEKIISCNDRYLEIYGLEKGLIKPGMHLEDLIRHRLASGIAVTDPERYEAEFRTIRALRQPSTTLVELANGRTILMTNTPLSDGGWLGVHEDITERLQFETSLKVARAEAEKAHRRLLEAFEAVPVGLSMLDADKRYVLWNRNFADIYRDVADLLAPGRHFEDMVRAGIKRGQNPALPGQEEQWLTERLARIDMPDNSHEQVLSGNRWVRAEDRRMSDGGFIGVHVDITDLKRREESFRFLFDANPTPLMVYDIETLRFLAVNDAALAQYGYDREHFLSMTVLDLRPPDDRDDARKALFSRRSEQAQGRIRRHIRADGTEMEVAIFSREMEYQGRKALMAATIDLTERKRIENDARRTRDFLHAIIEHVPAIIIVKDARDLRYVLVNRWAEQYFGRPRTEIIGKTSRDIFSEETAVFIEAQDQALLTTRSPQATAEHALKIPNGDTRIVSTTKLLILGDDGEPKYLITVVEDRTEAKDAEAQIAHMAYLAHHDPLTDLPNRALFNKHLSSIIESASLSHDSFALMCIDLDHFKDVNDLFGHAVGDALLREVARRLRMAAADSFVARVGGDEFVAITTAASAEAVAQRMLASIIDAPLDIGGIPVSVGLSIGIARFPIDGSDAATLLANADAALYQAKAAGRGAACYFGTDVQVSRLRTLQRDLTVRSGGADQPRDNPAGRVAGGSGRR